MVDWRQSLAGVDEDYLVGISNKGIVKRAYKDIEAAGSEALTAAEGLDWSAPELTVAAGGETVQLSLPKHLPPCGYGRTAGPAGGRKRRARGEKRRGGR